MIFFFLNIYCGANKCKHVNQMYFFLNLLEFPLKEVSLDSPVFSQSMLAKKILLIIGTFCM